MWPNPQFPADLVTFTEETFMENFRFCTVIALKHNINFLNVINKMCVVYPHSMPVFVNIN